MSVARSSLCGLILACRLYLCNCAEVFGIQDVLLPSHVVNDVTRRGIEEYLNATITTNRSANTYEYGEILHLSILFYEAQRSGYLPENNRIPWRGDSALFDQGWRTKESLTGGWYSGGGNTKFVFPMAYSATVLGWGMIEYPDAYNLTGLTPYMLDSLKWVYDFLIACHTKTRRLYYQIGDCEADEQEWIRPEDIEGDRPSFFVDPQTPGSDMAGETSAAMVTCYLIFNTTDPEYANRCLEKAKTLYRVAKKYRGIYPGTWPYESSSYGDELTWAAAWLYRATDDELYLGDAKTLYDEFDIQSNARAFGWNDKRPAVQLLLYGLTANDNYKDAFMRYMKSWLPGGKVKYTPRGLAWRNRNAPLKYAAATSFLALVGADLGMEKETLRDFAVNQIHYMLGDSGRSYVVGYGWDSPRRPQHRASSCPDLSLPCTKYEHYTRNKGPNPHVLFGALVGGPKANDEFKDERNNYSQNSVACDYNAGFQSAVAGLRHLQAIGELHPYDDLAF